MANVALTNEEKVPVTIEPLSAAGRPASIQAGSVVREVVFGNATLADGADELNFDIVSGDLPGSSQVAVKADADLGDGVVEISIVIDVEVSGAQAANLGASFGAPVPK